jgi:hypothetical protein
MRYLQAGRNRRRAHPFARVPGIERDHGIDARIDGLDAGKLRLEQRLGGELALAQALRELARRERQVDAHVCSRPRI